ncbi:acetylornithine/succinyldiaminopimelate transaminase [Diaphorobacter aerolatus]|nr:acetylornithine/succinyldiaminopimelate transaminase [Diaphorobacter aerolatus]
MIHTRRRCAMSQSHIHSAPGIGEPHRAPRTADAYTEVMVPVYSPLDLLAVRAQGATVWDAAGKEYIDLSGGIAVNALGHCNPALIEALTAQAHRLWHISNTYKSDSTLRLAGALIRLTFAERVFFANSGAEANEAAFKLARRYGLQQSPRKYEIVSAQNSFHGRSLFTVSVGGQPKYSNGFGPAIEGIRHVPFNDLGALEHAVSENTCAVVLEPVQGESGVLPATREYLACARALCDRHNALLILDEVQTGVGRLGTLFAYEHFGVVPDVMTIAKAIGCGIPLSAMLTMARFAEHLGQGTHGTTFGGNSLACAVGEAALHAISQPELLYGVLERHDYLVSRLRQIGERYGVFDEVRGIGLLIGCVLAEPWHGKARDVAKGALTHGVMVLQAGQDVMRLAPSLNISYSEIDEGLARLEALAQELNHETVNC